MLCVILGYIAHELVIYVRVVHWSDFRGTGRTLEDTSYFVHCLPVWVESSYSATISYTISLCILLGSFTKLYTLKLM